jgi:hypothetical protein
MPCSAGFFEVPVCCCASGAIIRGSQNKPILQRVERAILVLIMLLGNMNISLLAIELNQPMALGKTWEVRPARGCRACHGPSGWAKAKQEHCRLRLCALDG